MQDLSLLMKNKSIVRAMLMAGLVNLPCLHAKSNSIAYLPNTMGDILGPNENTPAGSCLGGYDFTIEFNGNCVYSDIIEQFVDYLDEAAPSCGHDALTELRILLDVGSDEEVLSQISSICDNAWNAHIASEGYPWADVTGYGPEWDKEYYDGNTHWNEEHETLYNTTIEGEPANRLKDDAYFVDGLYDSHAQRKPIEYPSHLDNFDQCELRSVMCCWPSDRQANDNNGNCATPYMRGVSMLILQTIPTFALLIWPDLHPLPLRYLTG